MKLLMLNVLITQHR